MELIKRTERIQRRASKFILDLPFICDVSYSKRLELLDLIPFCYWHEFLDLVFSFKCVNGIININGNVLPSIQIRQRATRSADPNCLKFTTPKCRTATFQRSFISRCARVWNVLPKELTTKNINLGRFKSDLYEYYKSALNIYDTVCLVTSPVICLVQIRVVINSNVCPCVRLVKLHCRLISTQENFLQERTALEPILRKVFLGANWPFYITKDLMKNVSCSFCKGCCNWRKAVAYTLPLIDSLHILVFVFVQI